MLQSRRSQLLLLLLPLNLRAESSGWLGQLHKLLLLSVVRPYRPTAAAVEPAGPVNQPGQLLLLLLNLVAD